jgi:hypothetical protein
MHASLIKLFNNWVRTLIHNNDKLSTPVPLSFIILFLLLTLNRTQMTSHGSSDEGNAQSHTDGLAREGFPLYLVGGTSGSWLHDASPVCGVAVREAPSAPL